MLQLEELQAMLKKHNINIKNTESEVDFLIEFSTKNIMTCKKYVLKKMKNIPISKRFENKVILYMQLSCEMEIEDLVKSHFKEEHYEMLTELLRKNMDKEK